jgi:signal transduction histidine kinase
MSSALFAATHRRMVLWNIAVTGVIIAALAVVAYVAASHVISGEIDNQLSTRAAEEQAHLSHDPSDFNDDDHDYDTNAPGVFLLLLSPTGTVLHNSLNVQFAGLPDMNAVRDALASSQPDLRNANVGANGSIEVRLRTERVMHGRVLVGLIQLGISTQPYEHELHMLLLALAIVGGGGLVLALGGSFFLASRALVPVRTAFRRQRDFVADASHELRTPLMLIRADIDVLGRELRTIRAKFPSAKATAEPSGESTLSGPLALAKAEKEASIIEVEQVDDQLELVDDALGEIDRMTRLLRELLLLARMDAGAIKIPHQPVALSDQLESLVDQVRRRAEAHGLTVKADLEPGVFVMGNSDQLRQLWLILLDNAIRYNRPEGSITVTCQTEAHYARVSIADAGIGIAQADLPRLFERFYRADKAHAHGLLPARRHPSTSFSPGVGDSAAQGGAGAGLGLAIAREVAQMHNGHISIESTPGEGSVFTVRLPLATQH